MPKTEPKTIVTLYVFASESTAGREYQTLLYSDGTTSCECPGWRYKKKTLPDGSRTCRHIRDIDAGLAARHALRVVEYAVSATRPKQQPVQIPNMLATVGRRFDFEE